MKIRYLLSWWLAALLLSGCVGSQVRPDQAVVSSLGAVYVVPMETAPLVVPGGGASSGGLGSVVSTLPRYTIGMARAVGVLSGVAILIELSASSNLKVESPPMVAPTETWLPSVALAEEAARLLRSAGRTPAVSPEIQPVPGVQDRSRTVYMENWMAPIRSWYNNDTPSPRYAALAEHGIEAILELGISNYEISAGKLLLQVHMKLIEPTSGKLLGRSRASSFTPLAPLEELFADDAVKFMEAIRLAGKELVASCLGDLGVVAK